MKTRTTRIAVLPEGENTFSDRATYIEVEDEGAGEFVAVSQPIGGRITLDAEEWPFIKNAIDEMFACIEVSHCKPKDKA